MDVTPAELRQALLLRQILLGNRAKVRLPADFWREPKWTCPDESTRTASRYFGLTAEQVKAAFQKWVRPQGFVQVVRDQACSSLLARSSRPAAI